MALMLAPMSPCRPTTKQKTPRDIHDGTEPWGKKNLTSNFSKASIWAIGKGKTPRCHISKVGFEIAASLALQLLNGFIPKLLLDLLSVGGPNPT